MSDESQCPLAFCDTETGGLDPAVHEILELALVLTSPDASRILDERCWRIRPEHPERIDPKAAAVNGYTAEGWADALSRADAMAEFCAAASGAFMAAHNVPLDRAFIEVALHSCDQSWPCRYRTIDTASMAWPLIRAGAVPDGKLGTLATHFGIDAGNAHSALDDARTCHRLYVRLMDTWSQGVMAPQLAASYPRGPFEGPVLVDPLGGRHAFRAGETWCGRRPHSGWLLVTTLGVARGDGRGVPIPDCLACLSAARATKEAA